jgi:hypothetical protein
VNGWRILVVWRDGSTEYVSRGTSDEPAVFRTRREAQAMADGFSHGWDEGEVQSVNVVRA